MTKKPLENSYSLPNASEHIDAVGLDRALRNFEYLSANYMQIVNKERMVVPFKLNRAQKYIFETLWPMINPETRLNRHREVVVVKSRQIGASVSIINFINYVCAFAEGIENMGIVHVFPGVDTIMKISKRKVEPIITGIHPDIMPHITRDSLGSSVVYNYDNILGIHRGNNYEFISANASSIRGDTLNIALFDECAWYRNPYDLMDVVGGSMPDFGFSLSVYFSTYGDKLNDFFMSKLETARDNPDEIDLIFVPWLLSYPEQPLGQNYNDLELSEYEKNVIVPALNKYHIPKEEWGDKIVWYRRKSLQVPHMKQEFPTTLEEVIQMGRNDSVFSKESLEYQRSISEDGQYYDLMTDVSTKKVKAVATDASSFKIYRNPIYGHRYIEIVDPITGQSEQTDNFAITIFDTESLETVATFRDKNRSVDEYADICVAASKLYNRAPICPERNVAEGLVVSIRALGYYNFWYESLQAKAKKEPGLRTTASSKDHMINERLCLLLDQKRIKIYSKEIIEELETFEKKVKRRSDGSLSVRMQARKGKHDDFVATLWIFAGTLDNRMLEGKKKVGFAII